MQLKYTENLYLDFLKAVAEVLKVPICSIEDIKISGTNVVVDDDSDVYQLKEGDILQVDV